MVLQFLESTAFNVRLCLLTLIMWCSDTTAKSFESLRGVRKRAIFNLKRSHLFIQRLLSLPKPYLSRVKLEIALSW